MNARTLVAVVLALLPPGLAAAAGIEDLPHDVLAAAEISAPPEPLDTLTGTTAWQGLGDLLAALNGVAGEPPQATSVAVLAAQWPHDEVLRDRLRALAGRRVVLAALPTGNQRGVGWVAAMEGEGGGESAQALVGLAAGLDLECRPAARGWVALVGRGEAPWAVGRQAGSWVVLGRAGSAPAVERVAQALEGRGSWPRLGDDPDFCGAMARIPAGTQVRGFLRPSSLVASLAGRAPGDPRLEAARTLLAGCEVLGLGRNLRPDRLETWAALRVATGAGGPLARLVGSLTNLGSPLVGALPAGTLVTWELGAAPEVAAEVVGAVLERVAPSLRHRIATLGGQLEEATGVNPVHDILGQLRPGIAGGWLAPDPDDRWRLPRPVVMAAVHEGAGIEAPLEACLRWAAGAVADLTQGMASASLQRATVAGVDTTSVALEGVVDLPLPCPTAAVVDRVLVLSPSPSAVREVVGAVCASRVRPREGAEPAPLVERLQADVGGLARAVAGVVRAAGNGARTAEGAAEADSLATALERTADGLGELRAEARLEGEGADAWLLAHAQLELR